MPTNIFFQNRQSTIGVNPMKDVNENKNKNSETEKKDYSSEFKEECKKEDQIQFSLSILRIFMLIVIFIMAILTCVINSKKLDSALIYFEIQAYYYLFQFELFFGIFTEIQYAETLAQPVPLILKQSGAELIGSYSHESAAKLIDYYANLNERVEQLAGTTDGDSLMDMMRMEAPFYFLKDNWQDNLRMQNIVQIAYNLYNDLMTYGGLDCRLADLILSKNYLKIQIVNTEEADPANFKFDINDPNSYPNINEQVIYFSVRNIDSILNLVLNFSTKISEVGKNANNALKKRYTKYQIALICIIALYFALTLVSTLYNRHCFNRRYIYLFKKRDKDEIIYDEITKFRKLLENFSYDLSYDYAYYKTMIKMGYTPSEIYNKIGHSGLNSSIIGIEKKGTNGKQKGKKKIERKFGNKNIIQKDNNLDNSSQQILPNGNKKTAEEELELEITEEERENNFRKKSEASFFIKAIFFLNFIVIVFLAMVVGFLIINQKNYDKLRAENSIGVNFLQRMPLVAQLLIYSVISAIHDNSMLIAIPFEMYSMAIYENYYNIDTSISGNTILEGLGISFFNVAYVQLNVARKNIAMFVGEKNNYLKNAKRVEKLYEDGRNFCVYASIYGVRPTGTANMFAVINNINTLVGRCHTPYVYGINDKGLNSALDYMVHVLVNAYSQYVKLKESGDPTANMLFLKDSGVSLVQSNLMGVLQHVQYGDSMRILSDIQDEFEDAKKKQLLCCLGTVIFAIGILFCIFGLVYNRMKFFLEVIETVDYNFNKIYDEDENISN